MGSQSLPRAGPWARPIPAINVPGFVELNAGTIGATIALVSGRGKHAVRLAVAATQARSAPEPAATESVRLPRPRSRCLHRKIPNAEPCRRPPAVPRPIPTHWPPVNGGSDSPGIPRSETILLGELWLLSHATARSRRMTRLVSDVVGWKTTIARSGTHRWGGRRAVNARPCR